MSEVSRVPDPAGVNVCRSAPAPGICDQHGVDFGECADEHPPEVSRVQDGWSSHGWWIGDGEAPDDGPDLVARCGGPGMCPVCKSEKATLVSRVQEPEPRRWPIGSKQPTDADLRVQSTQNGVIFKSLANGRRWHAEPESGGDDRIYSWYAINGKNSAEGGMELVEVVDGPPAPRPVDNAWRIEITVPLGLPGDLRDQLFTAVADTVRDWEPDDRQGWDAFVSAHPVYDEFTGGGVPMTDDRDIPEEMVEKAIARVAHEVYEAWRVTANRDAHVGDAIRAAASQAVSAALAGRQVVALPEADEIHDATAEARWYTPPDSDAAMTAYLNANGVPEIVTADDDYWSPDDLERDGLTRIAAARYARRLAAGSGSGEQS